MDALFYLKEKVPQPSGDGSTEVYVDNTFDFHVIKDGNVITGIETVTGKEELKQQALFASIKQMGSDYVDPSDGVQWVETLMGEVSTAVLIYQVKSAVSGVSSACSVVFTPQSDGTLGYYLEVTL